MGNWPDIVQIVSILTVSGNGYSLVQKYEWQGENKCLKSQLDFTNFMSLKLYDIIV